MKDCKYQLKLLIRSHNPDIVILVETRNNIREACSIISSLNFPNCKVIPSEGFSGGIWLLWKDFTLFFVNIISNGKDFSLLNY